MRMSDVQNKAEKAVNLRMTRSRSNNQHKGLKRQFVTDDYSDSESELEVAPEHDSIDMDEVERRVLSTRRPSAQIHEAPKENSESIESPTSDSDGQTPDDQDLEESENDSEAEPEVTLPLDRSVTSDNDLNDNNLTRHSQRQHKPVIRLTYDKPGHAIDEPVTIVHHGMVIQLELSPKIASSSSKHKDCTPGPAQAFMGP